MVKRYILLFRSIKNTKPSQLFNRLKLLIKRKLLSNFATQSYSSITALPPEINVSLNSNLPHALFKPRNKLVRISENNNIEVGFLNIWRPLQNPMKWHPVEMKKGTRLWLLNLHYMEFIEALSNENWFQFIKDWIGANKPYKKGYWLDNWNSYSLSIRVVVWMQQYERRGDLLSEADKTLLLRSLVGQIKFLKSNLELDIGGNHLIKNIKALLWASKFFEGPEADSWRELGLKLLRAAIREQVTPDGAHFELSPAYHVQVFADFLECYSVLDDCQTKHELELILPKMAQFLTDMVHPDGKISLFSDGGLDMTYSPKECLSIFNDLIGIPVEQSEIISYPFAGYFGLRHLDTLILMDVADFAPRYLPAHGHGDALSFEWSVASERVIIDPGVFEYNQGELRDFSRSTLSHNTVTLDNKEQSEFWSAFRVGRQASILNREIRTEFDKLLVSASHNGYSRLAGKPVHEREIVMAASSIKIHDKILNGRGQQAISRIMLDPDIYVEEENQRYFLRGKNINIAIECDFPIAVEETICFLNFGHKFHTKQLVIDFGFAPCSCIMKLTVCPVSY